MLVAGGPGTWLEVMCMRQQQAGLLPLGLTGGLVEGMCFNGKGLKGLKKGLHDVAPEGAGPVCRQFHTSGVLTLFGAGGLDSNAWV